MANEAGIPLEALAGHHGVPAEQTLRNVIGDREEAEIQKWIRRVTDLEMADIEETHLLNFESYFSRELIQLKAFVAPGLVKLDAYSIEVTSHGWYVVRAIAMVFDKYVQADGQRAHFSKIL